MTYVLILSVATQLVPVGYYDSAERCRVAGTEAKVYNIRGDDFTNASGSTIGFVCIPADRVG